LNLPIPRVTTIPRLLERLELAARSSRRRGILLEGREMPQKVELLASSSFELAEIFSPGHRPARDDRQDFGQLIDDLPGTSGLPPAGNDAPSKRVSRNPHQAMGKNSQ
jgi:hypothetical protein